MTQALGGVDLEVSAGYLLKQAQTALRGAMETVLRPLGLSVAQYACLDLLAQQPGLSNAELARGVFVTRQSMNAVLQGLERDGLVRRPDAAPAGRALPAQLTSRGRDVLRPASEAVREVEERMVADLDQATQELLRAALASCAEALAAPPVTPRATAAAGSL